MVNTTSHQEMIKKILIVAMFIVLLIVTFLIINPFIPAILISILLAYIFHIPYKKLNKKIKNPNTTAFLFCIFTILVILICLWFVVQIAIGEIIKSYSYVQTQDMLAPLKIILGGANIPPQFAIFFDQAIENGMSSLISMVSNWVMNIPTIFLQLVVLLFTLFYFLRDGDALQIYLKNILPFRKKIRERFFSRFKRITKGVIYGMVMIGLINGIISGIGFYIFQAPSPFVLTVLAIVLGILPIIGTWTVWIPAGVFMIVSGNYFWGVGLLIYSLVTTNISTNILWPTFVGKKAGMSNAIALVGMLGGLYLLGLIGLIIGPLVLDYFILFIEFYKKGELKRLI